MKIPFKGFFLVGLLFENLGFIRLGRDDSDLGFACDERDLSA